MGRVRAIENSRVAGRALVRIAVVLAAMAAHPALGQSTLSGGRGAPLVPDADTVPPTHFTMSFGASYAATPRDPFQLSPAAITFGFTNRLDIGLALRSWSPSDLEARGATFDPQVTLKLRLLTESLRWPAVALSLAGDHAFDGWDLSPSVVLHKNRGPWLFTAQLGYREPLHHGLADPPGPFGGLAAGYWWSASLSTYLQAVGEGGPDRHLWLMPGLSWSLLGPDPGEKVREALRAKAKQSVAALEAELGVKIDTALDQATLASVSATSSPAFVGRTPRLSTPGRVTFFVTGGPGLGAGPAWRVMAGIQISTFDEFLQDSDGDGIPDRLDQCPFEPEDWDGYQDEDGCPDHGTEVLRKRAEARLKAVESEAGKLTTPVPRFRLRIPLGEIPAPGVRREEAPLYERLAPRDAAPPAAPPRAPSPSQQPAGSPSGPKKTPGALKAVRPEETHAQTAPAPSRSAPVGTARVASAVAVVPAPATDRRSSAATVSASWAIPRNPPGAAASELHVKPPAVRRRTPAHAAVTVSVVVLPPSSVVTKPAPMIRVSRGGGASGPPVEVEQELAAMASVQFSDSGEPLAGADEDSILRVMRLAVSEGDEVLVWARAREPRLLPEAARRAEAILELATRQGAVAATRVTTSPAEAKIVVEVSATREQLRQAYRGDADAGIPADATSVDVAGGGEATWRQLREAALRNRPMIARCLGPDAGDARVRTGEAVVRIAVDAEGAVAAALRQDSPLWRPAVDACLARRAREWRFPRSEGGYVIDVPVRVVARGAAPR